MRRSHGLGLDGKTEFLRPHHFKRRGQQRLGRGRGEGQSRWRRSPEPVEQDIQCSGADWFAQDVCGALDIRFFFPLPLASAGINDNWTLRSAASQLFYEPCSLNRVQLDVENDEVGEAMRQKG